MAERIDVSDLTRAKSDQLNADDLVAGPITVQITGVKKLSGEQPLAIQIEGGHMPWKPCKTMIRLLCRAWGTDAGVWVGRWLRLYCDTNVKWAGTEVGGIRVSHVSHINAKIELPLASTRGRKQVWRLEPLGIDEQQQTGKPTANLADLLHENELTVEDFDRWRISIGKPVSSMMLSDEMASIAAWLAAKPGRIEAIRKA